jgi:hypothetical protein
VHIAEADHVSVPPGTTVVGLIVKLVKLLVASSSLVASPPLPSSAAAATTVDENISSVVPSSISIVAIADILTSFFSNHPF